MWLKIAPLGACQSHLGRVKGHATHFLIGWPVGSTPLGCHGNQFHLSPTSISNRVRREPCRPGEFRGHLMAQVQPSICQPWRARIDCSSVPASARFLSLTRSKLRLCSANHRAGYFSNLACDWLSIVWAYSKQKTENRHWWQWAMLSKALSGTSWDYETV